MASIDQLPRGLRHVPETKADWLAWREKAMLYRIVMRGKADADEGARNEVITLAAANPAYDALVFGVTFEPRARIGRPAGWYPLIPYGFQVRLFDWIDGVMSVLPGTPDARLGRGDGIVEKARGMAGTWTFCHYAGTGWLYKDSFVATFMSRIQDSVEKKNQTGTIFHKLEAGLGLDSKVPEFIKMLVDGREEVVQVRRPGWQIPEGYTARENNTELTLSHPTKTNVITGTATTAVAGVGHRVGMWIVDEAAKFDEFRATWHSLTAVTDHKFALSSADIRYNTAFRELARVAEDAVKRGIAGPSFMRLLPADHPEQDELWEEEISARHAGMPGAREEMAREYFLDYEAGATNKIYPRAQLIVPKPLTYMPATETLDFTIDPGIRNMCAFHCIKYNPQFDRYGVMLSYANNGKPADFYASLVTASPLSQYYEYGEEEEKVMEFFELYGSRIRFFVGDPAGKSKVSGEKGKLKSFYGDFHEATIELTDGRRPITIWSSDKPEYKNDDHRHSALNWLLERLDFNATPDVEMTLEAVREHRFKAVQSERDVITLPSGAVRFWGHDRVLAIEYYAAHRKLGFNAEVTGSAPVQRVGPSGKAYGSGGNGGGRQRGSGLRKFRPGQFSS